MFYNLHTHERICKSQWTKMVTTQLIVDAVNALDAKSPPTFLDVIQPVGDETFFYSSFCARGGGA
jgi:hypothetical protein